MNLLAARAGEGELTDDEQREIDTYERVGHFLSLLKTRISRPSSDWGPRSSTRFGREAKRICEYCLLPQRFDVLTFQIDHVIARKHRGSDEPDNVALVCFACN